MTPKEKANELLGSFIDYVPDVENYKEIQQHCALICINEILSDKRNPLACEPKSDFYEYWQQVKYEVSVLYKNLL